MTTILAQLGRSNAIDSHLSQIAKCSIQPSVRAKAYRCQLEGKMKWPEEREWKWTDKIYGEGRFMPKISERVLTVIPPFLETLNCATVDRSSVVRRVAAEFLIRNIESIGIDSLALARRFAADVSPSVAERGEFAMRQLAKDSKSS